LAGGAQDRVGKVIGGDAIVTVPDGLSKLLDALAAALSSCAGRRGVDCNLIR
jgi:hypothetical protein